MKEEIAVLLDDNKIITSFDHANQICIYKKESNAWVLEKKISGIRLKGVTISEVQKEILNIIEKLEGCNILLGKVIIGVPYNILDRQGIIICEADEYSEYIYDEILKDQYLKLEKEKKKVKEVKDVKEEYKGPEKMDENGGYFLDLCELQRNHPEITSKKALLPFLENTIFFELHIICSHVMPWLDHELNKYNLTYHSEPYEDKKVHVIVEHCVCNS